MLEEIEILKARTILLNNGNIMSGCGIYFIHYNFKKLRVEPVFEKYFLN